MKSKVKIMFFVVVILIVAISGQVVAGCTSFVFQQTQVDFYNGYLTAKTEKNDHVWWNNYLRVSTSIHHDPGFSTAFGPTVSKSFANTVTSTCGTSYPSVIDYFYSFHFGSCASCGVDDDANIVVYN
ncbi:MAG: hypothetical protein KAG94_06835 [Clostridiales bacterium]|nr:hypothetical protein [Clostridiales bacterium]